MKKSLFKYGEKHGAFECTEDLGCSLTSEFHELEELGNSDSCGVQVGLGKESKKKERTLSKTTVRRAFIIETLEDFFRNHKQRQKC